MISKEAEASAPPSYEESTSATQQNAHNQNIQQQRLTSVNIPLNDESRGNIGGNTSLPMFITARTSVYGPCPVEMDCPYCQAHIVTHIDRVAGLLPWIILGACVVLGFFLFALPWCFCCVPFCADSCLDVVHSCPACKRHLGRFNRM